MTEKKKEKGQMTVAEIGRLGGNSTFKKYGRGFYEEIGRKGGRKVRELVEAGKAEAEKEEKGGRKKKGSK